MSKKKINNRLDKLFQGIDNEPESKKARGLSGNEKKANKRDTIPFPNLSANKTPEPSSALDVSNQAEKARTQESTYITPSTMLSTAFRIDESNWATLKVVDELEQRTWGIEEQMLVKQVADQLSLALENARLFQEAQRRAKEMTALADVAREISATLELQQVMERIANQALLILGAASSAVYVPDPEFKTLTAISAIGSNANEIKADIVTIGEGILGNIALKKVAEISNNASDNPNAITIEGTDKTPNEHLMAAPIHSLDRFSGLLVVWRIGENEPFLESELEFLVSLAQQASIAVENARLFEETQERAEELSILNEMARELSAEMNLNSIAETAYRYINRLTDATNFYIALYDENTSLVNFPVFVHRHKRISVPSKKLENGLVENVIQTKEPLYLTNEINKIRDSAWLENLPGENTESPLCWLGVPLLVGNKPIGVMTVQSFDTPDLYSDHDKDLMMTIASQVAIAIENARLFKQEKTRARREKILREISARIRATNDPEMIAKSTVRELGQALGVSTFIRLGSNEALTHSDTEAGNEKK